MGLLCLPPKVWYNKIMETISGGPKPTFNADEVLKAVNLNQATKNWVATEVPPDNVGNPGDVVFIPGGPGGLPIGGGKVLQVVTWTSTADTQQTNKADFEPIPGMQVSITPTSATSIVLVTASMNANLTGTVESQLAYFQISDSSDNPLLGAEQRRLGIEAYSGTGNMQLSSSLYIQGVDTPNTTSPITYKVSYKCYSTNHSVRVLNGEARAQMTAIEVSQ